MDTTRWKSVLVPVEVYSEIKSEGRTISGQLRWIFTIYKRSSDAVNTPAKKVLD